MTPSLCCPLSSIISGLRGQVAYPVSSRLDIMLFMLGPYSWSPRPRIERTAFIFSVSNTDYNLNKIMMITGHGRIEKLPMKKRKMRED